MKHITFNSDAEVIELARQEARSRKTTLNALFRESVEDLAARDERRSKALRVFEDLDSHITHIPKFTREEMNER